MPAAKPRVRRYGGRPLPSVSADEDAERKGIAGNAKKAYIGAAIQRAKAGNKTEHAAPEKPASKTSAHAAEHAAPAHKAAKPATPAKPQPQPKYGHKKRETAEERARRLRAEATGNGARLGNVRASIAQWERNIAGERDPERRAQYIRERDELQAEERQLSAWMEAYRRESGGKTSPRSDEPARAQATPQPAKDSGREPTRYREDIAAELGELHRQRAAINEQIRRGDVRERGALLERGLETDNKIAALEREMAQAPSRRATIPREERIAASTQRRIEHQRPRAEITTQAPDKIDLSKAYKGEDKARKISSVQERQAAALRSLAEEDSPQNEARYRAEKAPEVARLDAEMEELYREREDTQDRRERNRINAEMRELARRRKAAYEPIYKRELSTVKAERPAPARPSLFRRKPKPKREADTVKISKAFQDPDVRAAYNRMEELKSQRERAEGAEYRRLDAEVRAAYERYAALRKAQDTREPG